MEEITIKSMTGYGRHKEIINGREITIEIKSVNHRYLDLTIKTPRIYTFLDDSIKKNISREISRGKVDIYISIDSKNESDIVIDVNEKLLVQYANLFNKVSAKYNIKNDFTVTQITKISDIISIKKEEENTEQLTCDVLSVLNIALNSFKEMREIEGEQLRQDISLRKDTIVNIVRKIEEKSPESVHKYKEKLHQKIQEVLENSVISQDRIIQEVAIFADKVNVCEETTRLLSHILQLEKMLSLNEPVGRKMDFLIQEFNREANTIGSKASDLSVSELVIELKSEIEKIREQIQNIE